MRRKTEEDLKELNACYFKEMTEKMELQMKLDAERNTKLKSASPLRESLTLQEDDDDLRPGVKNVKSPEFGKQTTTEEAEFEPLSLNDLSD